MTIRKKEVIIITKKFPQIYSSNINDIREKKEFYDEIGLSDIFIVKPKYLMQSIELSYARYMFYKEMGIEINKDNYFLNKYLKLIIK